MSAESLYIPTFIHLRNYSVYSLSEGAIKVSQLTAFAKANKMPAIALTDRNNMFGALEFSLKAAGDGVQPLRLVLRSQRHAGRRLAGLGGVAAVADDPAGDVLVAAEAYRSAVAGRVGVHAGPPVVGTACS